MSHDLTRHVLDLSNDGKRGRSSSCGLKRMQLTAELVMTLLRSLPRAEIASITSWASGMLQRDIVGTLPAELAFQILCYLDVPELLRLRLVSRAWNRLVEDQSVWVTQCAAHTPPIRPLPATWADLTARRQLLQLSPADPPWDEDESFGFDLEDYYTSDLSGQFLRQPAASRSIGRIWERTGALPFYNSKPAASPRPARSAPALHDQVILSHLASPSSIPKPNYKHLYLVHAILARRMAVPRPRNIADAASSSTKRRVPRPYILNSSSSIRAGGLPAHSEAVYSVCLVHRDMAVLRESPPEPGDMAGLWYDPYAHMDLTGPTPTLATWPERTSTSSSPRTPAANSQSQTLVFTGRDWLLSASRDCTLRLWQLACPEPRVVKVFSGGHDTSVLTHYVVEVPHVASARSSPRLGGQAGTRLLAVSGGHDGRICVWDIENGDGKPEHSWRAHSDAVLFLRGDDERIVSCSKDRTIRVWDMHTYEQLLFIGANSTQSHRGSANALGLTKQYIVTASSDRTIRVWDIRTGALLANLDADMRGISNIAFEPRASPFTGFRPTLPGSTLLGTVVAGSSDATIKTFHLVRVPSRAHEVSFHEMLGLGDALAPAARNVADAEPPASSVILVPAYQHWAACQCPDDVRPRGVRCPRCLDRGHRELVRSLHVGERVTVSGSYDGTVKVWDRIDGQLLSSLSAQSIGRVLCVTADRMRIISSGIDGRIILWDYATGLDTAFVAP